MTRATILWNIFQKKIFEKFGHIKTSIILK